MPSFPQPVILSGFQKELSPQKPSRGLTLGRTLLSQSWVFHACFFSELRTHPEPQEFDGLTEIKSSMGYRLSINTWNNVRPHRRTQNCKLKQDTIFFAYKICKDCHESDNTLRWQGHWDGHSQALPWEYKLLSGGNLANCIKALKISPGKSPEMLKKLDAQGLFISALGVIVFKKGNQSNYPQIGEWLNKLRGGHSMEDSRAI